MKRTCTDIFLENIKIQKSVKCLNIDKFLYTETVKLFKHKLKIYNRNYKKKSINQRLKKYIELENLFKKIIISKWTFNL
jgi:hypothetical protein